MSISDVRVWLSRYNPVGKWMLFIHSYSHDRTSGTRVDPCRYNHLTMRGWTLFTFRLHANEIKAVLFWQNSHNLANHLWSHLKVNSMGSFAAAFRDVHVKIIALLLTQSCAADTVVEFFAPSQTVQIKGCRLNCLKRMTRLCREVLKWKEAW